MTLFLQEKLCSRAKYLFALRSFIGWVMISVTICAFVFLIIQTVLPKKEMALSPGGKAEFGYFNEYDFTKTELAFIFGSPVLFLAIILSLLWGWLVYRNYSFESKEDSLEVHYGIIWKKHNSIPYQKIQDIEIKKGIPERLTGLATLCIQTAGYGKFPPVKTKRGSLISATYHDACYGAEASIPGLLSEQAFEFRNKILSQREKLQGRS